MGLFNRSKKDRDTDKNREQSIIDEVEYTDKDSLLYGDSIYEEEDKPDEEEIINDIYENTVDNTNESLYESNEIDNIYNEIEDDSSKETETICSKELKKKLSNIARNGCNIVVSGCIGSGVSTIAYNLAVTLANLGYKTLIVDFDTVDKQQSIISKEMFKALGCESVGIELAVNEKASLGKTVSAVRKNLYAIGYGAAVDSYDIETALKIENIPEFMSTAKAQFEFVVYDIPLDNIIKYAKSTVTLADKFLMVSEANTAGTMKFINRITNIEDENLLYMIISKSILLLNKYIDGCNIMGLKLGKVKYYTAYIDNIIENLAGEDIGIHTKSMGEIIEIPYAEYDDTWHKSGAFANSKSGEETYKKVLELAL